MYLALFTNLYDLFHCGIWITILQVEHEGIVEKYAILRDHRNVLSIAFRLEVTQVLTIYLDAAVLRLKETENHIEQRNFAKAARHNDRVCGS